MARLPAREAGCSFEPKLTIAGHSFGTSCRSADVPSPDSSGPLTGCASRAAAAPRRHYPGTVRALATGRIHPDKVSLAGSALPTLAAPRSRNRGSARVFCRRATVGRRACDGAAFSARDHPLRHPDWVAPQPRSVMEYAADRRSGASGGQERTRFKSTSASRKKSPFIDHAARSGEMISLPPSAFMIWVPVR